MAQKRKAKKKVAKKATKKKDSPRWPSYTTSTKANIIESFGARETHRGHVRIWLTPGEEKLFTREAAMMLVIKILRSSSALSNEDVIACLKGM